jgi:uncharacterized BrkB/YihY/UPF0761 family membrane protein
MEKYYNIGIAIEIIAAILYMVHINLKPLDSDYMFGALVTASLTSIFLFWQSFKNSNIDGTQKTIGIVCACLPLIFILAFIKMFI